jgi:ADP-heptose:LPS heptosyltransferase
MHILNLPVRLELGPQDIYPPGEYLSTDIVAAQMLLMADGGSMVPLREVRRFVTGAPPRNILIQRAGGFGDLILLTPVLREIKRRWPSVHLAVSTMGHYGVALANLPFVDEIVQFPVPLAVAETFDAWVFLENAIEKNSRAKELHMTELFAEIVGITDIADLHPAYAVKPTEAIWCNEAYPRNSMPRVCVQVGASAKCRVYPQQLIINGCEDMIQRGWEVFLLGTPGEIKWDQRVQLPPTLHDLTRSGLTFRQSCALINTADCVIGSDSALIHVAGALRVPAVGLYGPFPWKLRTKHCPTTVALTGSVNSKACPCFHHASATMRNHFPANCPSKDKGVCEVLADIEPKRIVRQAEKIMRKVSPLLNGVVPFEPAKA